MSLSLKLYPNKALRVVCKPVKKVADNHLSLAAKMHGVMKDHRGLGLSAPQVGLTIQLITINTMGLDSGVKRTMFNPEIVENSEEIFDFEEGCLSLPKRFLNLKRSNKIKVKYLSSQNKEIIEEFQGVTAVCVAHEIDHLMGRMFIDKELDKVLNT